jgi:hypothetical protein
MARTLVKTITDKRENILINGNFTFAQRNTGTVNLGGGESYISVDRWKLGYNSGSWSGTPQAALTTSVPPTSNSRRALVLQGTPTVKSTGVNIQARQRVESYMARKLIAGQKATLSFWYVNDVNAGVDANIQVALGYPNSIDNFVSVTTFLTENFNPAASGSWQQKSVTFTVPTNALNGLDVFISWSNINTGGNRQFYLTDVMLHEGEEAMDSYVMAGRTYVEELQLCQRYYEKSFDLETTPAAGVAAGRIRFLNYSATVAHDTHHNMQFKVVKRPATLVLTAYTHTGFTATFDNVSSFGGNMFISGLGVNLPSFNHWTCDAEL